MFSGRFTAMPEMKCEPNRRFSGSLKYTNEDSFLKRPRLLDSLVPCFVPLPIIHLSSDCQESTVHSVSVKCHTSPVLHVV